MAEGKNKNPVLALQFRRDSQEAMNAFEFLKKFKRKQGKFITGLINWYIKNADIMGVNFDFDTGEVSQGQFVTALMDWYSKNAADYDLSFDSDSGEIKQGKFVAALIDWYFKNAMDYNLVYDKKSEKIVDLTHMFETFEKIGISKKEIIEIYGSFDELLSVKLEKMASLFGRTNGLSYNSEEQEKNTFINSAKSQNIQQDGFREQPGEEISTSGTEDLCEDSSASNNAVNENFFGDFNEANSDLEEDDSWMLGMAGTGTKTD